MGTSRSRSKIWILVLGLPTLGAIVAFLYFFVGWQIRRAPAQPAPMNHQLMTEAGISCLFCHSEATKSPVAGIPSVELCMGCHEVVNAPSFVIQQLAQFWNNQEPIPWARVYRVPRFVYFSHEVHIAKGLNCEDCHGDVAHMKEAQPVTKMVMGWCLHCHNSQPNADQLHDCVVCHK